MRDKLIPEEKIMAIQEQLSGIIVEQLLRVRNSTCSTPTCMLTYVLGIKSAFDMGLFDALVYRHIRPGVVQGFCLDGLK